jgi:uncharacterized protein
MYSPKCSITMRYHAGVAGHLRWLKRWKQPRLPGWMTWMRHTTVATRSPITCEHVGRARRNLIPMPDVLVDANYLVALGYPRDRFHDRARAFAAHPGYRLLVPDIVLVEAMYNLQRLGGVDAAVRYARLLLERAAPFVSMAPVDYLRAVDLLDNYRNVPLDFVDCCIAALAERLTSHIFTCDRRDFGILRPTHVEYFELLP